MVLVGFIPAAKRKKNKPVTLGFVWWVYTSTIILIEYTNKGANVKVLIILDH